MFKTGAMLIEMLNFIRVILKTILVRPHNSKQNPEIHLTVLVMGKDVNG